MSLPRSTAAIRAAAALAALVVGENPGTEKHEYRTGLPTPGRMCQVGVELAFGEFVPHWPAQRACMADV